MIYKDRQDAGQALALNLKKYAPEKPIILALPRGGVVLGYEVAQELNAPLDVIVPRKIGAPFNPELGIGAIAPGGVKVLNNEIIGGFNISQEEIDQIIKAETIEMSRRIKLYRRNLPDIDLTDRTVIVVDDGVATGVSTLAAVLSIKQLNPKQIILAIPVCPLGSIHMFEEYVNDFVCLNAMANFYAVGAYYEDFAQTTDEEVIDLLERSKR